MPQRNQWNTLQRMRCLRWQKNKRGDQCPWTDPQNQQIPTMELTSNMNLREELDYAISLLERVQELLPEGNDSLAIEHFLNVHRNRYQQEFYD